MTPKVYADFQNLDNFNRLRLTCAGTIENLNNQGIQLQEGLNLTFYMDDADDQGRPDELQTQGIVHFSEEERCWVAVIDWSAIRHASEEGTSDNNTMKQGSWPHKEREAKKLGVRESDT